MAHPDHPLITADSYLTPHDVARVYNVSYRTVLQWIRNGQIEAYQLAGKLYRIPPGALDHVAQPVVRRQDLLYQQPRVGLPSTSTAQPTHQKGQP